MATLYDGVPVFVPVSGVNPPDTDPIALQAKLILGLEARWHSIPLSAGKPGVVGDWSLEWTITHPANRPSLFWQATVLESEMLFPVFVRDNEFIAAINVWIDSTAGTPTGGTCSLYKQLINGTAVDATEVDDFGVAGDPNFWDTDDTPEVMTMGGNTYTVDPQYDYFIGLVSPTVTDGQTSFLYGLEVQTRFHAGV